MNREMTNVRMRILFSILYNQDKGIVAASIAQSLHISKSTVGRAIEYFKEQKWVRDDKLKLTVLGEKLVQKYWEQKENLVFWLAEDVGMDRIQAEEEALTLILTLGKKSLKAFMKQIEEKQQNCELCEIEGFCERCIDYLLDDGEYDISFTFYKENPKKYMRVSMANEGFYHPGKLLVKNGIGIVRLESKKIIRNTPIGKGLLTARVNNLSYLQEQQYVDAIHEGNVWKFPVSCMRFTYNKGERVLMGSATLKLSSSIGVMYMPESVAIFAMTVTL